MNSQTSGNRGNLNKSIDLSRNSSPTWLSGYFNSNRRYVSYTRAPPLGVEERMEKSPGRGIRKISSFRFGNELARPDRRFGARRYDAIILAQTVNSAGFARLHPTVLTCDSVSSRTGRVERIRRNISARQREKEKEEGEKKGEIRRRERAVPRRKDTRKREASREIRF